MKARAWLYNAQSEVSGATIGNNAFGYGYDSIGNRVWSSANVVTNSYLANNLNQYASISSLHTSSPPREPTFGSTITQSGSMADVFVHRFSTKYFDSETELYDYLCFI